MKTSTSRMAGEGESSVSPEDDSESSISSTDDDKAPLLNNGD